MTAVAMPPCPPAKQPLRLVLLSLFVLLSIAGCRPSEPPGEKAGHDQTATPPAQSIVIEPLVVFEEPDPPAEHGEFPLEPAIPQATAPAQQMKPPAAADVDQPKSNARIAIVIDDMGHHQHIGSQLLNLDLDLTFSFLPGAPHTAEQVSVAARQRRDILLHLPMEPRDPSWDPGPGALLVSDSAEEIRRKMDVMLATLPQAIGANNHMGSRFTEEMPQMREVVAALRGRSLFFLDSYTSTASVGVAAARLAGVPATRRHVFLDNIQEVAAVCAQIHRLADLARKRGWAIGIGHPSQATLTALNECARHLPPGVELVGIHHLVR